MTGYVDTSVVLRVLLRQRGAIRDWSRWDVVCSSELLKVEARRVLDRLRLESLLDDSRVAEAHDELARIEESIAFVSLTPSRSRASCRFRCPLSVKTLDAIHLASAVLYREPETGEITFVSHDAQQNDGGTGPWASSGVG